MRIKKIVVGEMEVNCYIIIDELSSECAIIDAGAEPQKIIDFIENEKLSPKAIILTHGHYDHIGACAEVMNRFNVPLVSGENESEILNSSVKNLSVIFGSNLTLNADMFLKDGDEYSIGALKFKTIATPGHTPGGICLYFENEGVLISGDTLFFGSVGRTDLYLGNTSDLLNSLKKLAKLSDDTIVYPGHGQQTTIKFEKENNPYVKP